MMVGRMYSDVPAEDGTQSASARTSDRIASRIRSSSMAGMQRRSPPSCMRSAVEGVEPGAFAAVVHALAVRVEPEEPDLAVGAAESLEAVEHLLRVMKNRRGGVQRERPGRSDDPLE